jgi:hypothetical protein
LSARELAARIAALDWPALEAELDAEGWSLTPALLDAPECAALEALFDEPARFRKTIDMGRHAYGEGSYRYFAEPLPGPVAALRAALYARLVPLARRWSERLRRTDTWPDAFEDFRARCAAAGQTRPTPLLLRYSAGGYNRLHQDRYGEIAFPLQAVIGLDEPGRDYTGGEFLLVEQRARTQSRGIALPLPRGSALLFAAGDRPVPGRRGDVRASFRHGVSRVHSGRRTCLGIIFHDAR